MSQVLLATIELNVFDQAGIPHRLRALLDSGSQVSLILKKTVQKLGLRQAVSSSLALSGIGEAPAGSCGVTKLQVSPADRESPVLSVEAVVVSKICSSLPSYPIDSHEFGHLSALSLADPHWFKSAPIDLLLRADMYASILESGVVSGPPGAPKAFNTIFGWIVMGPIGPVVNHLQSLSLMVTPSLEETVHRFWEIESVPIKPIVNPEHELVETHFKDAVFRTERGRFGVALPFKGSSKPTFRGSLVIADKRWSHLECKLLQKPVLYGLYLDFLKDYLESGHMSLVTTPIAESAYVIPHHCVTKMDQGNAKIRVVFDASAKDANNQSLNDTLHIGPKLQRDIVSILLLLLFRVRPFVFICDIWQMYRQILVREDDRRFQYIRFRFLVDQPIQTYQLNTVTYGVSAAP